MKTILTVAGGLLLEGVACTMLSESFDNPSLQALAPIGALLLLSGAVLLILCLVARFLARSPTDSDKDPPAEAGANELSLDSSSLK